MTAARVLADDLTGALDAGACFADGAQPLRVAWQEPFPDEGSFVIDSESRDIAPEEAKCRVLHQLPRVSAGGIAFKKIDSLLRGNTMVETAACIGSGCFASVVLAPAFPAQRRITRNGRQLARDAENEDWRPMEPSLFAVATEHSAPVRRVAVDGEARGGGVFICDAESDAHLASLPARLAQIDRPILWCGTAGLAHSWRHNKGVAAPPRGRCILVAIGSDHPVTTTQLQALAADGAVVQHSTSPEESAAASAVVTEGLADDQTVVVQLRRPPGDDGRQRLADSVACLLAGLRAPDVFIASGGDTLMALLRAVGATHASVEGEVAPGLPRGRVCGGAWDGRPFVSKSGGFGERETLRDLVRAMRSEPVP